MVLNHELVPKSINTSKENASQENQGFAHIEEAYVQEHQLFQKMADTCRKDKQESHIFQESKAELQ